MDGHYLSQTEKNIISQKIVSYLQAGSGNVLVAYLFGSFLTDAPFSDIDLGMITREDLKRPLVFEIELERSLQVQIPFPFDVRVLNRAPVSFSQSVIRNGKPILDKAPNLRADFETRVLKLYFDFQPFRRQYLREVINAPI